jgi:hypothetical protein
MASFRPWGEFFDTSRLSSRVDVGRAGVNLRYWLYNYVAVGLGLAAVLTGVFGSKLAVLLVAGAVGGHALLHVPSAASRVNSAAAELNDKVSNKMEGLAQKIKGF